MAFSRYYNGSLTTSRPPAQILTSPSLARSGGIVELADAVRENREPANSARLALDTLEVLLAQEKAATERCTIEL